MRDQVEAAFVSCTTNAEPDKWQVAAEFIFAAELPVFAGHFPGQPIVPGVFLVETVRHLAERSCAQPLTIRSVDNARFTAAVPPNTTVAVHVEITRSGDVFDCRATSAVEGQAAMKLRLKLVLQPLPA